MLGDSSYSSGGYSHSSSRGYSSYSKGDSSRTSHKPPSSSTVEPSDKINTETFMNNVLPDSNTVPYLIYFYHDYNIRCEYWTKLLKDMKNVSNTNIILMLFTVRLYRYHMYLLYIIELRYSETCLMRPPLIIVLRSPIIYNYILSVV